ncbi:MAG: phage tail protein [Gemmatimonadota bacterium]
MNRLNPIFLVLAALAFPVAARAQEPAASSKPKEIVVVGSKVPELRTPTRALLLKPQDLEAAEGVAILEVNDARLAKVLKRAFEEKEGLGDLELSALQDDGVQKWKLTNVRVTSYSVSGASESGTAQISWSHQVGGVEHEDNWRSRAAPVQGIAPNDALTAARFSITVDGYEIAQFSELVGLNARAKPPTVVLKRGKSSSMEMWTWHEAARTSEMAAARKSATLVMYNYDGKPIARYKLTNAWPSKIEIGGLKAGSSEVMMETVTLVCEHIQRVSP